MFSAIDRTFVTGNQQDQVKKYACLSTDSKPTTGIRNGSSVIEMDTGKTYLFDEDGGEWVELPNSGGGGGGGDFTTATITVVNNTEFSEYIQVPTLVEAGVDVPAHIEYQFESWNTVEKTVPLYKGSASGPSSIQAINATVTGDIEKHSDEGGYAWFVITGDGSITISE